MPTLFSLELYAADLLRERRADAAQATLAAQLPHSPKPRPDLSLRTHLADGLRALAIRLDPCAEPTLLAATSH